MNRQPWWISLLVASLLASACPTADASEVTIEKLAWLAGTWSGEQDGHWTEEHWRVPRGGLMLGVNRSGDAQAARSFEFLRIQADAAGDISYWAAPGGKPAVPFRLIASTADSATFENPTHDYPSRIHYQLVDGDLEATISGPNGSNPMRWRWRRLD